MIMKKHSFLSTLLAILFAIGNSFVLTSCLDDDDEPYYPGPGINAFYDTHLDGLWQLTNINDRQVAPSETNFMQFDDNGDGYYYSYRNSFLNSEDMAYYCQEGRTSRDNYILNVSYGSHRFDPSNASTMTYWFTDQYMRLWLSWRQNDGNRVTSIYSRINALPQ